MWQPRRLELRDLCDLGHWLIDDPESRTLFEDSWRLAAFEACNSPTEWEEFLAAHADDARTRALRSVYETIDSQNQLLPRGRRRTPVELPDCY